MCLPILSFVGRWRARRVASLNCQRASPIQATIPAHIRAGPHALAASCSMAPVGSASPGWPRARAIAMAPTTMCSSAMTAKPVRAMTSSVLVFDTASAASAASPSGVALSVMSTLAVHGAFGVDFLGPFSGQFHRAADHQGVRCRVYLHQGIAGAEHHEVLRPRLDAEAPGGGGLPGIFQRLAAEP